MSVLVTYASAKGSTHEIADRIALRLQRYTTPVDCVAIKDVTPEILTKYDNIVIGSAIHTMNWLKPARRFIHHNCKTLHSKSVWAFSVGAPPDERGMLDEEGKMGTMIRKDLPELRSHKLFQGRFHKQDLGFFLGILFTCCVPTSKVLWGDARDWERIEEWADLLGQQIRAAQSEVPTNS